MKVFKTIDEKFAEINFKKIVEYKYGVSYERNVHNNVHNFVQRLDLLHKASGKHLIQSYDKNLTDNKGIGNTCVGLSMYEAKLCIKKMKQMGWKIKDGKKPY